MILPTTLLSPFPIITVILFHLILLFHGRPLRVAASSFLPRTSPLTSTNLQLQLLLSSNTFAFSSLLLNHITRNVPCISQVTTGMGVIPCFTQTAAPPSHNITCSSTLFSMALIYTLPRAFAPSSTNENGAK